MFTTRMFVNDDTGLAYPFGPTLRAPRGGHFRIRLTNNLLMAEGEDMKTELDQSGYKLPDWLALHSHGLHAGDA